MAVSSLEGLAERPSGRRRFELGADPDQQVFGAVARDELDAEG
jgi:hypothetical protein